MAVPPMTRKRITKYHYQPVKPLKPSSATPPRSRRFSRVLRLFGYKPQAVAIKSVRYLEASDSGFVIKHQSAMPYPRLGVLFASLVAIGVASSIPLDKSIASVVSLDSLQQLFQINESKQHMARLKLKSLQDVLPILPIKPVIDEPVAIQLASPEIAHVTVQPIAKPQPSQEIPPSISVVQSVELVSPKMQPVAFKPLSIEKQDKVTATTPPNMALVKHTPIVIQEKQIQISKVLIQEKTEAENENKIFATVKRGDNLSRIFKRHHLSIGDLHRILKLGRKVNVLKSLDIGQKLFMHADASGHILTLQFKRPEHKTLHIAFTGEDGFIVTQHNQALGFTLEKQAELISLKISESGTLEKMAQPLELSSELVAQVVDIFHEELDLRKQALQVGDHLQVLFEGYFYQDELVRVKHVLAVALGHQQRHYLAARYTDKEGRTNYYTPQGRSLYPAFLRAPVKGARVTSYFNRSRRHPILRIVRPHLGVDYGAGWGTPIHATAKGVVKHRGWHGGYGRTIIIQHSSKYQTLYAHMSRYGKGFKQGDTIKQGQIIGYVGSSGLSTGSHLHYEVWVDDEPQDPLRIKLPQATTITLMQKVDFLKKSRALFAQLSTDTQLAGVYE